MLASCAAQLPEGDQWSYEVKWDGHCTLAVKDGARVTLLSRNLKDATAQYPRVARGAPPKAAATAGLRMFTASSSDLVARTRIRLRALALQPVRTLLTQRPPRRVSSCASGTTSERFATYR